MIGSVEYMELFSRQEKLNFITFTLINTNFGNKTASGWAVLQGVLLKIKTIKKLKNHKLESHMNRKPNDNYQQRLTTFLSQIKTVETRSADLYQIMDTPVFRDLETALMMATMDSGTNPA